MEMQFKNEIKKLADIVVWADNGIEEMRMDLSSLTEEEFKNLDAVKDLEAVKKVVLESMERHAAYTSALNKDLADKAAKIELLEKEIEGRKEGYWALKEKHDKLEKELADCKAKIRHQKENLDGINKTLEIRTKENESLIAVKNNKDKEIEAHESENARLSEKIVELKGEVNKLNRFLKMQEDLTRDWKNKYVEAQKEIDEWESDTGEHKTIVQQQEYIDGLNKDLSYWKGAFETQATSLAEVRKRNDDLVDTLNKSSDRVEELEKQVKFLEEELNKTCTCKELDLKGHNRREMALVNELADKNDEIKKLEESIEELKKKNFDDFKRHNTDIINQAKCICELKEDIKYYKNQERIRTDQLRATERKVDELWGLVNELKKEKKEGDDYAREGFKLYVKNTLAEAEGDKNEANEVITEAVRSAYAEWSKAQKEEETEVKGNGRTSSGRYPWGAKVNDIPCGEDAIE